jgi:hypothetical protein
VRLKSLPRVSPPTFPGAEPHRDAPGLIINYTLLV